VIDVGAVQQENISKCTPVLVEAVRQERDILPECEVRGGLLGSLAESLAFLRAVDAVESDTFSAVVVQDFDGVAVKDGDNFSMKSRSKARENA